MLSCSFLGNSRLNVVISFCICFLTCVIFLLVCCLSQVTTMEFLIIIGIEWAMVCNANCLINYFGIDYCIYDELLRNITIIQMFSRLIAIIAIFISIIIMTSSNHGNHPAQTNKIVFDIYCWKRTMIRRISGQNIYCMAYVCIRATLSNQADHGYWFFHAAMNWLEIR